MDWRIGQSRRVMLLSGGSFAVCCWIKPMCLFVAVTDNDWFALHASKIAVEEVNFWKPRRRPHSRPSNPANCCYLNFMPRTNYRATKGKFRVSM
jgi:hypothetical protein